MWQSLVSFLNESICICVCLSIEEAEDPTLLLKNIHSTKHRFRQVCYSVYVFVCGWVGGGT